MLDSNASEGKPPYTNVVLLGDGSGKSTIAGQLLLLTGRVDEKQVQEAKEEADRHGRPDSYLSYLIDIMDTTEEERVQGRTDELCYERFESEGQRFRIFDTPAHNINSSGMFLGMFAADVGVVVLSALITDWRTVKESLVHIIKMARVMDIHWIVFAINHMDHPDVMWSESIYNSIEEIVRSSPGHCTCTKDDVRCVPTSGLEGLNISTRVDNTHCPWWKGPCLLEAINSIHVTRLEDINLIQVTRLEKLRLQNPSIKVRREIAASRIRMPLFDKVKNNIVFGRLISGILRAGDRVLIMPSGIEVTVLGIYEDDSFEIGSKPIHAKTTAYVELSDIDEIDITPGFVLSSITNPISTRTVFTAELNFFGLTFIDYLWFRENENNDDYLDRFFMLHMHALAKRCRIKVICKMYASGLDPDGLDLDGLEVDPDGLEVDRLLEILYTRPSINVFCQIQVLDPICVEDEPMPPIYEEEFSSLALYSEKDGNMVASGFLRGDYFT